MADWLRIAIDFAALAAAVYMFIASSRFADFKNTLFKDIRAEFVSKEVYESQRSELKEDIGELKRRVFNGRFYRDEPR